MLQALIRNSAMPCCNNPVKLFAQVLVRWGLQCFGEQFYGLREPPHLLLSPISFNYRAALQMFHKL